MEFIPDSEDSKDRNFVTALARGLDVLRCFHRNEVELTNNDFATRTGLPKPTVSRLTYTLCQLDYLVANPQNGSYRLGAGVLHLGFGVLAGMELGDRAQQVMRDLRNGPNSYITVALGERHRLEVVYIAVERSREDVALTMHIGSRLPLFYSALGRTILVSMSEEERQAVFDLVLVEKPDEIQTCRDSFDQAQKEFAADGFCRSFGEWRSDVNGIAVPVVSLNGSRICGLNVGGPSFHVKKKQLETVYAPQLKEAAKLLSLRP